MMNSESDALTRRAEKSKLRKEYVKGRSDKIKSEREEFIKRWKHLPISSKFKVTVSNGFSAVGLSDIEVADILNMFEAKSVNATKIE
jgi:hypothetical protein